MKLYYTFDEIEQFIELTNGQSTIGRSSSATFTIRHETISKIHTLLKFDNGILTVEDMDSSNGTFVNGVKVQKAEIKPNDHLKVGKVNFRIEMTPDEVAAYQKLRGGATTDDDATPAEGSEPVSDQQGQKSETFFDISQINKNTPAINSNLATTTTDQTSNATGQSFLGNRKNLILVLGSLSVLLLMVVVLMSLNSGVQNNGSVGAQPKGSQSESVKKQIEHDRLIKEGIDIFIPQPENAKNKFKEALRLVQNRNATSSLISLCEIWQKGEMNWSKVSRSDFRKNLDDIRNEDEGQPGAILYNFVNDMTKLEKFEQENENKFAEIVSLLNSFKVEDAQSHLNNISKESVFYDIADKKIKATRVKQIEQYKSRIRNFRDGDNAQEEARMIQMLLPLLPQDEQKDYSERLVKLKSGLDKEKIWVQANEKLKANDLDGARQLYAMLENTDEHYFEAQDKLTYIKEENARQNVKILYDLQGEGKAALKVIADTMSSKLNDLSDKIKKVDFLYSEALRKGENNPDDTTAHTLLEQLLEAEPNPDNEYHKRAKNLLSTWKDPVQICDRKYALAKEKLKLKDFVNARQLVKTIIEMKPDYDVSFVMNAINKYVQDELNRNYRNTSSNETKRTTLKNLSKIVQIGDRDFDTVSNGLLELDGSK